MATPLLTPDGSLIAAISAAVDASEADRLDAIGEQLKDITSTTSWAVVSGSGTSTQRSPGGPVNSTTWCACIVSDLLARPGVMSGCLRDSEQQRVALTTAVGL